MKPRHRRSGKLLLAVAAAFLIAGCGAAQGPLAPSGPAIANRSHNVKPLDGASTEVDIQNSWTASIAGSGSADCWTISPGLPIVGAGDIAGPVTLTYSPSTICGVPSAIAISYGPAAFTGAKCTFYVTYDVSFSFSVTQSGNTDCSIEYPPVGVNAILTYDQKATSGRRRH